jgi:chromosome segregation ATPase
MSLYEMEKLSEELEKYDLPESLKAELSADAQSATVDGALLEKYKEVRDEYLKRRLIQAMFSHLGTYDEENFQIPNVPTAEEKEALEQRRSAVLAQVQEKAQNIQRQTLELQTKYSSFLARRDEYQRLMEEMKAQKEAGLDESTVDDDEEEVDEAALAAQEEKLAALQRRRAALEVQLRTVQQEQVRVQQSLQNSKVHLDELQHKAGTEYDVSLETTEKEKLQTENQDLQAKIAVTQEIQLFYEILRQLMEELEGIRILGVEQGKEDGQDVVMTIQAFQQYKIVFGLRIVKNKKKSGDHFVVCSAKFLSDTLVTGPVSEEDGVPVVRLRIPPLDDLVSLASNMPGESLQFVLREALNRIAVIEGRVYELAVLQEEVLTQIGKLYEGQFGGEDQEVVCSLNEQMTIVLRLTPDCPLAPGSCYIDQLVGVGGWQPKVVEQIKNKVHQSKYHRPIEIIHAVKAEVKRLQEEEGLLLPETPHLPAKDNFFGGGQRNSK